MSPLPRRMLGSAASWENPQVHLSPLPEGLTYVGVAVAIRPFVGSPHQILNSLHASEVYFVTTIETSVILLSCAGGSVIFSPGSKNKSRYIPV